MRRSNKELWLAFIAILSITTLYFFVVGQFRTIPPASDFFGHSLGVLGFLLMLMTETLYTLRKRSRSARWGRMSDWLNFHIFTGLVGPYLVLLHTSWKYNGLAGLLSLLTLIIVGSGFIGRYIYTAVPRSLDGVEIESDFLSQQADAAVARLQTVLASRSADMQARLERSLPAVLTGRLGFGGRLRWGLARLRLDPGLRRWGDELVDLLNDQDLLRRQIASLAAARRLLALWHAVHIPIGITLFTAAFIHIGAAIYYATLLR